MADEKTLTIVVPCYNSASYLDRCVSSILSLHAPDIEVIIVDDGSSRDNTPALADAWQARLPDVVRVIHQPNGGHGAAVMRGLAEARGLYFKVVDSDDILDPEAFMQALATLRRFSTPKGGEPLDLLICNYRYEREGEGARLMEYRGQLPQGRPFGWDEIGHFGPSHYMLMHALTYRTELLRRCGLDLPRHTFYVDVIYAYVPLPWCRRLFYLDVTPYRYLVGRADQSVNESVMIGLLDDQLRTNRCCIDAYRLETDVADTHLRSYMVGYLAMDMVISTVFCYLSGTSAAEREKNEVWERLREHDPWAWHACRHTFVGAWVSVPGRLGRFMTVHGYHLVRGIFKFN